MPLFALPFPNIDPVLISFGPFAIRWYALGYVVGILLGWWYAIKLAGNEKLWGKTPPMNRRHIDDFIVWLALGVILGGRLGYVLFYNLAWFAANPLQIFAVWSGGMSFHGGLLGSIIAVILFSRSRSIPVRSLLDIVSVTAPFAIFLVRIANFINGELWGRVTDVPWAFVFPGGGPEPRHPSQLYEAALEGLVMFALLRFLTHYMKALHRPGLVAGVFATAYGASRIFVEFFRQPDAHIGFLAGGFTMGMVLSLPLILIGIVLIWTARNDRA